VVEDPAQLGQGGTQPDRTLRHLQAHQALDGEHHPELVVERRKPVVPVGEHDDLPVVARLEELLGAAVHVPDDRLAAHHLLAVQDELEPQHAVGRRMLGADIEHHVAGLEACAGADRQLTRHVSIVPCHR
jgi:hypothetical protein